MKKENWITIAIIVAVIILAYFLINKAKPQTSEELAKCIGEKSKLYVQLGCPHCKIQEDMFGDNFKYLNSTDCFYERDKCISEGIEATPTWIINGQKYEGVQSIDTLKTLTGC